MEKKNSKSQSVRLPVSWIEWIDSHCQYGPSKSEFMTSAILAAMKKKGFIPGDESKRTYSKRVV